MIDIRWVTALPLFQVVVGEFNPVRSAGRVALSEERFEPTGCAWWKFPGLPSETTGSGKGVSISTGVRREPVTLGEQEIRFTEHRITS